MPSIELRREKKKPRANSDWAVYHVYVHHNIGAILRLVKKIESIMKWIELHQIENLNLNALNQERKGNAFVHRLPYIYLMSSNNNHIFFCRCMHTQIQGDVDYMHNVYLHSFNHNNNCYRLK